MQRHFRREPAVHPEQNVARQEFPQHDDSLTAILIDFDDAEVADAWLVGHHREVLG
ncbi:MAG: hypothetical protein HC774_07140 [Sphingomonadales bacterium]|nr:hypothetical protein [Sphingomonadales bacterium]